MRWRVRTTACSSRTRLGGQERNLRTMMEAVAEVARGDGSTGWTVALLNVCTWFATTFTDEAQADVFEATPGAKVCGIFSPPTRSERVEGGYLVSGRWPYSSARSPPTGPRSASGSTSPRAEIRGRWR